MADSSLPEITPTQEASSSEKPGAFRSLFLGRRQRGENPIFNAIPRQLRSRIGHLNIKGVVQGARYLSKEYARQAIPQRGEVSFDDRYEAEIAFVQLKHIAKQLENFPEFSSDISKFKDKSGPELFRFFRDVCSPELLQLRDLNPLSLEQLEEFLQGFGNNRIGAILKGLDKTYSKEDFVHLYKVVATKRVEANTSSVKVHENNLPTERKILIPVRGFDAPSLEQTVQIIRGYDAPLFEQTLQIIKGNLRELFIKAPKTEEDRKEQEKYERYLVEIRKFYILSGLLTAEASAWRRFVDLSMNESRLSSPTERKAVTFSDSRTVFHELSQGVPANTEMNRIVRMHNAFIEAYLQTNIFSPKVLNVESGNVMSDGLLTHNVQKLATSRNRSKAHAISENGAVKVLEQTVLHQAVIVIENGNQYSLKSEDHYLRSENHIESKDSPFIGLGDGEKAGDFIHLWAAARCLLEQKDDIQAALLALQREFPNLSDEKRRELLATAISLPRIYIEPPPAPASNELSSMSMSDLQIYTERKASEYKQKAPYSHQVTVFTFDNLAASFTTRSSHVSADGMDLASQTEEVERRMLQIIKDKKTEKIRGYKPNDKIDILQKVNGIDHTEIIPEYDESAEGQETYTGFMEVTHLLPLCNKLANRVKELMKEKKDQIGKTQSGAEIIRTPLSSPTVILDLIVRNIYKDAYINAGGKEYVIDPDMQVGLLWSNPDFTKNLDLYPLQKGLDVKRLLQLDGAALDSQLVSLIGMMANSLENSSLELVKATHEAVPWHPIQTGLNAIADKFHVARQEIGNFGMISGFQFPRTWQEAIRAGRSIHRATPAVENNQLLGFTMTFGYAYQENSKDPSSQKQLFASISTKGPENKVSRKTLENIRNKMQELNSLVATFAKINGGDAIGYSKFYNEDFPVSQAS